MLVFIVLDMFLLLSLSMLAMAQIATAAVNITTNEQANWHRYKYLQDLEGGFRNPFHRGILVNWRECMTPEKQPRLGPMLPEHMMPKPGEKGMSCTTGCCPRPAHGHEDGDEDL